jgi:hypothetical protein
MRKFYLYFFLVLSTFSSKFYSQTIHTIKFKKSNQLIYFFQKGIKSDTIVKAQSDVFYLIVPDSLKPYISILVDNAQLLATQNDSLVRINYLPGFNYESLYIKADNTTKKPSVKPPHQLQTLVNGTSALAKNQIRIKIVNKQEEEQVLENVFYYGN